MNTQNLSLPNILLLSMVLWLFISLCPYKQPYYTTVYCSSLPQVHIHRHAGNLENVGVVHHGHQQTLLIRGLI